MIDINNIPPEQSEIIRMLCQINLDSLQRIFDNNDHSGEDITMVLVYENISPSQWQETIMSRMEKFQDLHDYPEDLTVLNEEDLSMFRHLLTNVEDKFSDKYPLAISNLWNRLLLIEQTQSMASYPMLLSN